jgi:hypothetical protein
MLRLKNLQTSGNIASRKSIRDVLAGGFASQAIPEQKGGGNCGMLFARTALYSQNRRRDGDRAFEGMMVKRVMLTRRVELLGDRRFGIARAVPGVLIVVAVGW